MPPVISVIGKSDSGKTTIIEKLIPVLKKRGYRIGIIKHASHGFDADRRGKDSWRHKQAGADTVMVASPNRVAMIKDMTCENIDCLMEYFQDVDIVVTEGFKKENKPKIEVFRSGIHQEPLCVNDPNLIAFVTDADVDLEVPVFGLEEIEGLADLIEKIYL
jgi:molybdopterin-guanine dinucleotide biosynthesis protein B